MLDVMIYKNNQVGLGATYQGQYCLSDRLKEFYNFDEVLLHHITRDFYEYILEITSGADAKVELHGCEMFRVDEIGNVGRNLKVFAYDVNAKILAIRYSFRYSLENLNRWYYVAIPNDLKISI